MPYFEVTNFNFGLDLRKESVNGPAGTLRKLQNAIITPGGEIEKSFAFHPFSTVPAGSVGLMGDLYNFYTVAAGASVAPTPTTVGVHGCAIPGGATAVELLDWDRFGNQFYCVVLDSSGVINHYYNGALVPPTYAISPSLETKYASNIKTHKGKIYRVQFQLCTFSADGDPMQPYTGTGSGYVDTSQNDGDSQNLIALEVYYGDLALMSPYATQIWTMTANPATNQFKQTLRQAGTIAPRSMKGYGSGDVLYLAADGVRSLKARDQSLAASVSDIGSPIDPVIADLVRTMGPAWLSKAITLLEPYSGRVWLLLPDRCMILSAFPTPKITAWSEIRPPFAINYGAVAGDRIGLRDTSNNVYVYGPASVTMRRGRSFEENRGIDVRAFSERGPLVGVSPYYTEQTVDVEMPFLAMDQPATVKTFHSLDISCTGTWSLYAAYDPGNPTAEDFLGVVTGPTFPAQRFAMAGSSTHCSIRMRNTTPTVGGKISSFIFHYTSGESA